MLHYCRRGYRRKDLHRKLGNYVQDLGIMIISVMFIKMAHFLLVFFPILYFGDHYIDKTKINDPIYHLRVGPIFSSATSITINQSINLSFVTIFSIASRVL